MALEGPSFEKFETQSLWSMRRLLMYSPVRFIWEKLWFGFPWNNMIVYACVSGFMLP